MTGSVTFLSKSNLERDPVTLTIHLLKTQQTWNMKECCH